MFVYEEAWDYNSYLESDLIEYKEKQEKIYEKFYRTDKSRNKNSGGTGLGMSIMKKIVDIHKGKISLISQENIGTKTTLSFSIK